MKGVMTRGGGRRDNPLEQLAQRIQYLEQIAGAVQIGTTSVDADNGAVRLLVTATSHGFGAFNTVGHDGSAWYLAKAGDRTINRPLGVIESVTTNTFILVMRGKIRGWTGSTLGTRWLSPSTAGSTTTTRPSLDNEVISVFDVVATDTAVVNIDHNDAGVIPRLTALVRTTLSWTVGQAVRRQSSAPVFQLAYGETTGAWGVIESKTDVGGGTYEYVIVTHGLIQITGQWTGTLGQLWVKDSSLDAGDLTDDPTEQDVRIMTAWDADTGYVNIYRGPAAPAYTGLAKSTVTSSYTIPTAFNKRGQVRCDFSARYSGQNGSFNDYAATLKGVIHFSWDENNWSAKGFADRVGYKYGNSYSPFEDIQTQHHAISVSGQSRGTSEEVTDGDEYCSETTSGDKHGISLDIEVTAGGAVTVTLAGVKDYTGSGHLLSDTILFMGPTG